MKSIINNRLLAISDFVYDNDKVIDIGCDHGLLGIYLTLNRHNLKVISSDINEEPLKKAKDNLIKYHLEDKIITKMGNGLEAIDRDINTVIISGMGGINIVEILKTINDYPKVSKLIISPNNDFPLTRKCITKLGFNLTKEKIIYDKNKYYLVSCYLKSKRSPINYYFGKLDLVDKVNKQYYLDLVDKNRLIIKKLPRKYWFKRIKLVLENYYILLKTK